MSAFDHTVVACAAAVGPQVKEIVHAEDLSNVVILTNRCLNRALHKDMMRGKGTGANTQQTGANHHVSGVERSTGTSDDQREPGGVAGGHDGEIRGPESPLKSRSCDRENTKGFQDTPCAGEATLAFVESALPDLGRLSRAMERWVHPNVTLLFLMLAGFGVSDLSYTLRPCRRRQRASGWKRNN